MFQSRALVLVISVLPCATASNDKPNVVWILLEDVGIADLGFSARLHRSVEDQEHVPIKTPHIDALALSGARIKNYYTHMEASSSHRSMLTGRFECAACVEIHSDKFATIGHEVQDRGYRSHYIGRWHADAGSLGGASPIDCGFHSHIGADVSSSMPNANHLLTRKAMDLIHSRGVTEFRNQPFFMILRYTMPSLSGASARHMASDTCTHAGSWNRQAHCAHVLDLDEGIANITESLRMEDDFKNTYLIISALAAGLPSEGVYNYPFRGHQATSWEGGVHVPAVIFASRRIPAQVFEGIFHVADWTPTVLALLDGESPRPLKHVGKRDGKDLSESIQSRGRGVRRPIVIDCDCWRNSTIIVEQRVDGIWKLILGTPGDGRVFHEPSSFWSAHRDGTDIHDKLQDALLKGVSLFSVSQAAAKKRNQAFRSGTALLRDWLWGTTTIASSPNSFFLQHCAEAHTIFVEWAKVRLYRLDEDPYEQVNLADEYVDIVKQMVADHNMQRSTLSPGCPNSHLEAHSLGMTGVLCLIVIAHLAPLLFLTACFYLYRSVVVSSRAKPKPE